MSNADPSLKPSQSQFWQAFLAASIAMSAFAIYKAQMQSQLIPGFRPRLKWLALMGIFALNLAFGLIVLFRKRGNDPLWQKLDLSFVGTTPRIFGAILFAGSLPLLWYVRFDIFQKPPIMFSILLWAWLWITLLQAAGLKLLTQNSWTVSFSMALLFGGTAFILYFLLQPVTDYPFSLGWSEASRFYYGSLPFSKSIYGVKLPLSVMHGSRYFLLSIPFLFGSPSLWAARLWQSILWFVTNGLTAFLLVRNFRSGTLSKLLMGGWIVLFLFQGAVYYHLLVCVIIVLAGVKPEKNSGPLIAIIAASLWAGMSRVNWFPVPAMLAIAIYLLEVPFANKSFLQYVRKPIVWGVIGVGSAFVGQYLYILVSGNQDLSAFGSSFTSALLFDRWWPSETNLLGVIPGVLIISAPCFALLARTLSGRANLLHPLRWSGISAMLAVLLAGGLIVSTKIGGGGDLHNMDAYIVLLVITTFYILSGRVAPEDSSLPASKLDLAPAMNLLLIIPVVFALSRATPPIQYDARQADTDLNTLRTTVQSYSQNGEVLFIYERHLLTFGLIPGVKIVPEDEVVTLMEMAISNNQAYLEKFYHDLETHRFSAIVARKQSIRISDSGSFAEEGNAWNSLVAYRLLCEYEPALELESANIQVYVPREKSNCP